MVVGAYRWLARTAVTVFTTIEFAIKNWRDVLDVAFKQGMLGAIAWGQGIKHVLTVVIPELLKWFARNWREILTDLFHFSTTVFSNLAGNIIEIIKNVPALLRGEVKFKELWTPLAEGFEATLDELPEIAKRKKTDIEKKLAQGIRES